MTDLVISDVVISVEDGLYRLNDLHKAAGGEVRHRPNDWLKSEQTQSYVSFLKDKTDEGKSLSKQNQIVTIIKNGGSKKQGTYVCKNLVYKYAMWISHEFEFAVIEAFDSLVNNSAQHDLALAQWKKAMLLEKPCEWQKLYTDDFYKPIMRLFGWQFEGNKGGLPAVVGLITKQWIYNVVVPAEILEEIEIKKESEKIHQWFNDKGGREKLKYQIGMVSGIAKTCRTYGEFKIKAGCVFNDTPLQIEML